MAEAAFPGCAGHGGARRQESSSAQQLLVRVLPACPLGPRRPPGVHRTGWAPSRAHRLGGTRLRRGASHLPAPALAPKCEFISARALRWIVFASLAPRTNARLYRESTVEPDPGFHHNEVTR